MPEMYWVWTGLASGTATLVAAIVTTFIIGTIGRRKGAGVQKDSGLLKIFILAMSFYTFVILILSQIVFRGPPVGQLVSEGFGDNRVAWLMVAVVAEQSIRMVGLFKEICNPE